MGRIPGYPITQPDFLAHLRDFQYGQSGEASNQV
ncbi:hypothetical protein SPLC1_S130600 [Arthrospira platensis C1]|nr:hypothetical protein SPLC1_S130600 [Arthrospira platensis C1]